MSEQPASTQAQVAESPTLAPIVAADNPPDNDDASTYEDDANSSTASITSSVLEYRNIKGRTYHSDRYDTEYFTPNDDRQLESVDLSHHYLLVLLDNKLFLAPIKKDVQRVVDIGTGSGIWANDFADEYPSAEVTGTDLSPCQPEWVAPNVKFEIDDAALQWTWKDNTFDFVHIRYLFGAIKDWDFIFKEAYRCCAPGGWVQSAECDVEFRSDDGTLELEPVLKKFKWLFEEGGKKMGRPFFVKELQQKGMAAAGFQDLQVADYKIPVGGWAKDPKLAEIGQCTKLALENDLEGYTLFIWHNVLELPASEYQMFLLGLRKALKNRNVHSYMMVRYVYGQKPE